MTSARKKSFVSMVVITIVFIVGITMGMSFAYFSDSKTATNTLKFGKLRLSLSDSVSGSAVETLTLTGNGTNEDGWLEVGDTVTLTGSVGLEDYSMPAYVRMKVELYETTTGTSSSTGNKLAISAFTSNFLSQMSAIKDGSKQWFVVGNYMYLGNSLQSGDGEGFTYGADNTTSTITSNANKITITSDMMTGELQGKSVEVRLVFQAIQASGAFETETTLSGYTQDNAETIKGSKVWRNVFIDPAEEYEESSPYYAGYVRGNFKSSVTITNTANNTTSSTTYTQTTADTGEVTQTSYSAYTNTLVTAKGAIAPFQFFQASTNNTGDYVAFGWYPQTIKGDNTTIVEYYGKFPNENGFDCYLGSDTGLYMKMTVMSNRNNCYYSNGASVLYKEQYFKVEPIIWQVLNKDALNAGTETNALLHCVSGIRGMVYSTGFNNRTIDGETIYPNNYEYSYVRGYLNGLITYDSNSQVNVDNEDDYKDKGFLQYAFTSSQTALQNSGGKWKKGTIENVASSVNDSGDYVFLLSQADLKNTSLGFKNSTSADIARMRYPTDYAMGCKSSKGSATTTINDKEVAKGCSYFSRTPYRAQNNYFAYNVEVDASIGNVSSGYLGVVPALFLEL